MDDEKDQPSDTFHLDARLPDGSIFGRRRRGEDEAFAVLTPIKDDERLTEDHEIVRLSRGRTDCELNVESLGRGKGPAKVNSRKYRSNYDSIFGAKKKPAIC